MGGKYLSLGEAIGSLILLDPQNKKTIPEVGSLKIIRAVMNVIWSKEGSVKRADSVAKSRSGRESQ